MAALLKAEDAAAAAMFWYKEGREVRLGRVCRSSTGTGRVGFGAPTQPSERDCGGQAALLTRFAQSICSKRNLSHPFSDREISLPGRPVATSTSSIARRLRISDLFYEYSQPLLVQARIAVDLLAGSIIRCLCCSSTRVCGGYRNKRSRLIC